MLTLFKAKHHCVLGIDINITAINLLELSYTGDQYCVENYAHLLLPKNAIQAGVIKDVSQVATCLRSMLAQSNFSLKHVVVAMPDTLVMTKQFQVCQRLNARDIKALVNYEVGHLFSESKQHISFDFKRMPQSTANPELDDILILAARLEHVNQRIEVLRRAGIRAQIVDVESLALERIITLMAQYPTKTIAIFEVNSVSICCFVVHAAKVIFTREDILASSEMSTDTLSLKRLVVESIERACQFFYAAYPLHTISDIALKGELSQQPDVVDYLKIHIAIPLHLSFPFEQMKFATGVNPEAITCAAPLFMTACGLALHRGLIRGH